MHIIYMVKIVGMSFLPVQEVPLEVMNPRLNKSVHSKELVPLLFLCKYCLIHYKFHYHEEFLSILLAEVESTVLPDFLLAKFPPLLIMASLKNRIFRIPARQLNSKRVENSLKANIRPLVSTGLLLP